MSSLLHVIDEALKTNPLVIIVKRDDYIDFQRKISLTAPKPLDQTSHEVWYHVAPKEGLYTAAELSVFGNSLMPHLKREDQYSHLYEDRYHLNLSWFTFHEDIGVEKITVTEELELFDAVRDEFASFPQKNIENGKGKHTKSYELTHQRRVFVKTYPDVALAQDMLSGKVGKENHNSETKYSREIPKPVLYAYVPNGHPLKPTPSQSFLQRIFG